MDAKQKYEIVNGFWDKGQFRAAGGAPLLMTEREAAPHLRAGDIKLVSSAIRSAVETQKDATPDATPAKKGK